MPSDPNLEPSSPPDPFAVEGRRLTPAHRIVALLEVILCSDYPTQLALIGTFRAMGYQPSVGGQMRFGVVATLSLLDSVLLIGLMMFFLKAHGERPLEVFLGRRPLASEARVGLPLVVLALGMGFGILAAIQRYAPSLHTVDTNPLETIVRTPRDAWLFALVVIVPAGLREELQRAFLLRRFELWLGGATFGLIVTSIAFGAGHVYQGLDATIATGILGAFWGIVYLRRRSVVAPLVSHSGFNLVQTLQFLVVRS